MTVVVAVKDKHGIEWGWDSSITSGDITEPMVNDKVFHLGQNIYVGVTAVLRTLQAVRSFNPPENKRTDIQKYLESDFMDALIKHFEKKKVLDGMEPAKCEIEFLIGYKGRLFTVGPCFSVAEPSRDSYALGSGGMIALGSLNTTRGSAKTRVERALKASLSCNSICKPFHYLTQKG